MAQNNVNQIQDHATLFQQPEYQELFENKKQYEGGHDPEEVTRIAEWTKTRPGVVAASNGTVANVNHVLDRSPHHTLRSSVGTTTGGHGAR